MAAASELAFDTARLVLRNCLNRGVLETDRDTGEGMKLFIAAGLRLFIALVFTVAVLIVAFPALGVVLLEKKKPVSQIHLPDPVFPPEPIKPPAQATEELVVAPLRFFQNFIDRGWRN